MFIPFQKEKIKNAILFFAIEYRKKTKKNINQTRLYKFLAFLDFEIMEEYGELPLGLTYKAMDMGPVPIEIYEKKEEEYINNELYRFQNKKDNYNTVEIVVKNKNLLDLDYFSDIEIEKMYNIIEIYTDKSIVTSQISDATHEKIKAWKKRYKEEKNGIISYDKDVFVDISNKKEEDFTNAERRYAMLKAFEEIKK